ncbi:MAG: serine hydrolase domain-containing protein [Pseudomonadota bacterium]
MVRWTALVLAGWLGLAHADPLVERLEQEEDFSGVLLVGDIEGNASFRSVGFADEAAERAFSEDDVWRWASVTKQLIGVLIMQQVEAGSLSLDDTMAERLPEAKTKYADQITVRDLMRHTSGMRLPRAFPGPEDDVIEFCVRKAKRKPDTRVEYNGCETVLAAEILNRVSGRNWRELMREQIFQPVGMTRTIVKAPGQDAETVVGYQAAGTVERPIDVGLLDADSSVVGVAADLVKFNAALMRGDLMSDASRDALWQGEGRLGFVAIGAWSFSARLKGCGDAPVKMIERRGGLNGIQARNFIVPEKGKSLVVFTNRQNQEFGEVWMGQGLSYDLLSEVMCSGA